MRTVTLLFSVLLLLFFAFAIVESFSDSSKTQGSGCQDLIIHTDAVNCTKLNCPGYHIKLYQGDITYFTGFLNRSTDHLNMTNIDKIYHSSEISYQCSCSNMDKELRFNGTINIKDLPLPVSNPKHKLFFSGSGYYLNVSFPASEIQRSYQYFVTAKGIADFLGDRQFDTKPCERGSRLVYCAKILNSQLNAGYRVSYKVWSTNSIGRCSSKEVSHVLTFYDCYGDPRIPRVSKIGTDSVLITFSSDRKGIMMDPAYTVKVCAEGSCKHKDVKLSDVREVTFKELLPLTKYYASAMYHWPLGGFESNWTKPVSFTTKSEVPTSGPKTVTCSVNRASAETGYILRWEPPRRTSSVAITKYILKVSYSSVDTNTIDYIPQTQPPFEYNLLSKARKISVGILPCSDSGCGSESITEYTSCLYSEQSKAEPPRSSGKTIYILAGVIPLSLIVLCGAVIGLIFYVLRRRRRPPGPNVTTLPEYVQPRYEHEYEPEPKVEERYDEFPSQPERSLVQDEEVSVVIVPSESEASDSPATSESAL